jgi:hypothetical protein
LFQKLLLVLLQHIKPTPFIPTLYFKPFMDNHNEWEECNSETFWCEIGCYSHVVQLYENDEAFLNLLEDFVAGGITANDCVIIIATNEHLNVLEKRLCAHDLDVKALCASGQYIPLDANQTLQKFMANDLPDHDRLLEFLNEIFEPVRVTGRKVRAFGEMVAILWEQGNRSGTMLLEQYWNEHFEKEAFPLFCAYPRDKFPADADSALSAICKAHSKIIMPTEKSRFELNFQNLI